MIIEELFPELERFPTAKAQRKAMSGVREGFCEFGSLGVEKLRGLSFAPAVAVALRSAS